MSIADARFSIRGDSRLARPSLTDRHVSATITKPKYLINEERHTQTHQLFTRLLRLNDLEKEEKALKELSQRIRSENTDLKLDADYLVVDHKDHLAGMFNWFDIRTELFRTGSNPSVEPQCSTDAILDFVKFFIEIGKKEQGVDIILINQGRLYFEELVNEYEKMDNQDESEGFHKSLTDKQK